MVNHLAHMQEIVYEINRFYFRNMYVYTNTFTHEMTIIEKGADEFEGE